MLKFYILKNFTKKFLIFLGFDYRKYTVLKFKIKQKGMITYLMLLKKKQLMLMLIQVIIQEMMDMINQVGDHRTAKEAG